MSNKLINKSTKGTIQPGREFRALDKGYVSVDERTVEDLMVFAAGFAKLLKYYNLNDEEDGDWTRFITDEAVLLATIVNSKPQKIEKNFNASFSKAKKFKSPSKKELYLKKCFLEVYKIALKFDDWLLRFRDIERFSKKELPVRIEVLNAVTNKLVFQLKKLEIFQEVLYTNEEEKLDFSKLSDYWNVEIQLDEGWKKDNKEAQFEHLIDELETIFQSFYETLIYLRTKSPDYLRKSFATDTHYPETALFIAFLKLFEVTKGDLNQLNQRHLDFYYTRLLRQKKKKEKFDRVYLKFKPYPTAPISVVEKGTRFLGGVDTNGKDIVYRADSRINITKSSVEKLRTVYVGEKSINVKGEELKMTSGILSTEIPLSTKEVDQSIRHLQEAYAAFGEDQEEKSTSEKSMEMADVGISIASPVLFLSEGNRDVTVVFTFNSGGYEQFLKYLEDLSFYSKNSLEETFVQAFVEAFKIKITSQDGWFDVKRYVVSKNDDNKSLSIGFNLENSDPAIIAYDREIHKGDMELSYPLLKILLNGESYTYPYSLLKNLDLDQVIINTEVVGAKGLDVYNTVGQLNASNPFLPFGPVPRKGSYLLIGSNEIFQKSIEDLEIDIEWFDLPTLKTGLEGYYKEYDLDINNQSFKVDISVLGGGRWLPVDQKEREEIYLFRSKDKGQKDKTPHSSKALDNRTLISGLDISKLKLPANYSEVNKGLVYSNMLKRGFVKLELITPDFAFGHSVYPSVLSEVTMQNSKSGILNKGSKNKELPKPAYTPQIKSLSINYKSSAVITPGAATVNVKEAESRGQLYHIHPFGQIKTFPSLTEQNTRLLPEYNFQGALYIGVAKLQAPQKLSLLFEMKDEYTVSSEEDPPEIQWSYLKSNQWRKLKESRIVRDDTNGFLKTGIIEVDIPHDINTENSILDYDYSWLRVSALRNVKVASKIVNVYSQVITATLVDEDNDLSEHLEKPLPPRTITRSVDPMLGVESVLQPMESFDGLPAEKQTRFQTRIAEMLRHKNRAVSIWDFERLVLNSFPSIYKVTCLPNMTSKNLDAPGSALVVVTPYNSYLSNPNEPMASSDLLHQIKTFLSKHVSPFVQLEVRNPSYERIKVICSVKFTEDYNFGYNLQKLNDEIRRYISKNIEAQETNVDLGGKINTSDILTYLRTLPYVDFITEFSMVQAARDFKGKYVLLDTSREGDKKTYLKATKPWSVLVSAQEHQIAVLNEKYERSSSQAGIDLLELGEDFIIE